MKFNLIILACALLMPPSVLFGVVTTATTADETREVGAFTGLSVSGSFDVDVRQGQTQSVRIQSDAAIIRDIETFVEDGVLHIRVKRGVRFDSRNSKRVNVLITAPELQDIKLSGSGKLHAESVLSREVTNVSLSGSGSVMVSGRVNEANINLSGSGAVSFSGTSTITNVNLSGSGRVNCANLQSRVANVRLSGSGRVSLHAENNLSATIAGSGNVRYSGSPEVALVKNGSGSLTKL